MYALFQASFSQAHTLRHTRARSGLAVRPLRRPLQQLLATFIASRHRASFLFHPFLSPSVLFYFPPPRLVAALFFASPMCSTRFSTPLFAVANLGNVPVSDREGSAGRSRCALSHASLVCPPRSASSPLVFFPLSRRLLRFDVKYSDVSLGHTSVAAAEACLHAFVLGY